MHFYLGQWFQVIEQMKNTNTYKLAWAKAILDIVAKEKKNIISFNLIAEHMLKFYWNQMYFFKLKQGPLNQEPTLNKIVKETIETYQSFTKSKQPVWFNIAQTELLKDKTSYDKRIKRIVKVLHQDVSWRFKRIDSQEMPLYEIDKTKDQIIFSNESIDVLSKDGVLLTPHIYLEWAKLLEKFNQAPKIANKVAGSGLQEIKRQNLSPYREILLRLFENQPIRDFYTNEVLSMEQISVDHFIPWSYIYSDDIWNFVITSKSNNSKKSNRFSSKYFLKKLIEQNQRLISIIKESSFKKQIHEALENQYVEKFYSDFANNYTSF